MVSTLYGLAKHHNVSRNLIPVWIAKYEAGECNEEAEAADLLQQYEARIAALERLFRHLKDGHQCFAGILPIIKRGFVSYLDTRIPSSPPPQSAHRSGHTNQRQAQAYTWRFIEEQPVKRHPIVTHTPRRKRPLPRQPPTRHYHQPSRHLLILIVAHLILIAAL